MPAGTEFIDLHSTMFSIDGVGNLLLNTVGKLAEQVAKGNIPTVVGKGIPSQIGITNGVGASANIANVTFQVQDVYGTAIAGNFEFGIILSDAATGLGLTATTASGGVAAASSGGVILGALTASKAIAAQTNASGAFVLAITDTAKTGFYPAAYFGVYNNATVGAQLTSASYHA